MINARLIYAEPNTGYYSEAINLRYRIFFQPSGNSIESVFDNLEANSIHLLAIYNDEVIGYARLTITDAVS